MNSPAEPFARMGSNVCLLSVSNAIMYTVNAVLIASAALVGARLASSPVYSTVPVFMLFIFSMGFAFPASMLMKFIGRRMGFQLAACFGSIGAFICCYAITVQSFLLFCVGISMIGIHNAFGAFYRFAAADVSTEDFKSRAISYVLAGSVVAAFIGPNLANFTKSAISESLFAGSYLSAGVCYLLALVVVSFLQVPNVNVEEEKKAGRPLMQIASQPVFWLALCSATFGYGVMNLLMTSTPLAMHAQEMHFGQTAQVIQWHIVSMFAPSFFTGHLIRKFGELNIIFSGVFVLIACIITSFLLGDSFISFLLSLILLGIGWNFTFIGGTTLLTTTYAPSEKAKIQGLNDTIVFSVVSVTALMSGVLHHLWGWQIICLATLPPILVIGVFVLWLKRQRVVPAV